LNILARFPNLRKLELTADTDLAKYPNVRDKTDPDFDSTRVIFKQLHSGKIGLAFHEITIGIVHCSPPRRNQRLSVRVVEMCSTLFFWLSVLNLGITIALHVTDKFSALIFTNCQVHSYLLHHKLTEADNNRQNE
jgi:hypothetical protein